jgi:hypothetical protein
MSESILFSQEAGDLLSGVGDCGRVSAEGCA